MAQQVVPLRLRTTHVLLHKEKLEGTHLSLQYLQVTLAGLGRYRGASV